MKHGFLLGTAGVSLAIGCLSVATPSGDGTGSTGGTGGLGASAGKNAVGPCDPLAQNPVPVTLGTVLGIGRDAQGAVYLADHVEGTSIDRVFVSNGGTLYRKRVLGSGQSGGRLDADYTFSYDDDANSRALLVQVRGGQVTAMALGPSGSRALLGGDPAQEPLTVLAPSAIDGLPLQNLPGEVVVEYVADVADGRVIVVTRPMDDWTYADFRLFYGSQQAMIERHVENASRGNNTYITFFVGSVEYTVIFTVAMSADGGSNGGPTFVPGPGTLNSAGGETLDVIQRAPTPTSLPGFSFTCLGE